MYGELPVEGYAKSVPNNKQSKFGKSLTSRYRQSARWNNTYYLDSGFARMETDTQTIIGELNDEATWINGRLEVEKDSGRIFYRKYDKKGDLVNNSTQEFEFFRWSKFLKGKPTRRSIMYRSTKPTLSSPKKSDSEQEKDATDKNKPTTEKSNEFKNLEDTKNVEPQTDKEKKPSSKEANHAPSAPTTLKLTGAEAESYLKGIGINLDAFGRNGSSSRTITLTKNTTIVGSTR